MLKTLISLLFILSFTAHANVAFEVEGKLNLFKKSETSSIEYILQTKRETFHISNKNYFTYGCKEGEFLIVPNYIPEGTYSIVEILSCKEFGDDEMDSYCPKNLELVCGAPIDFKCVNHYCDQV